jgi:hypothetical protein
MDKEHFDFFTKNMQEKYDDLKEVYLENGLLLNADDTDEGSLVKLAKQHRTGL